jgi:hypothetical protein
MQSTRREEKLCSEDHNRELWSIQRGGRLSRLSDSAFCPNTIFLFFRLVALLEQAPKKVYNLIALRNVDFPFAAQMCQTIAHSWASIPRLSLG